MPPPSGSGQVRDRKRKSLAAQRLSDHADRLGTASCVDQLTINARVVVTVQSKRAMREGPLKETLSGGGPQKSQYRPTVFGGSVKGLALDLRRLLSGLRDLEAQSFRIPMGGFEPIRVRVKGLRNALGQPSGTKLTCSVPF
ncbi:MAG: hypothetical protein CBC48_16920 [bacterium TMED88]|nr:hypothetical protein [Deltaproteobacteria bacterium]OUV24970.1 MAG: hypothetical protein CBC48_16920 [bacterium TMED88]